MADTSRDSRWIERSLLDANIWRRSRNLLAPPAGAAAPPSQSLSRIPKAD